MKPKLNKQAISKIFLIVSAIDLILLAASLIFKNTPFILITFLLSFVFLYLARWYATND